jgi:hypothetical protein
MAGSEPHEDDEFPPRRPFGVPAGPAPTDPDEDEDTGAPARPAGVNGRAQPPATPS